MIINQWLWGHPIFTQSQLILAFSTSRVAGHAWPASDRQSHIKISHVVSKEQHFPLIDEGCFPARPHRFYQWNLPMIIQDSSCPIAAGSSLVVLPLAPEWAAQCSPAPPARSPPWSRGVPLAGQALVEGSWSTKDELPLNSWWINGKGDNVN